MNWFQKLVATKSNIGLAILRVGLGVLMLPFGLQKMFGYFGGFGYDATIGYFATSGIPAWLGFLIILAESLGAIIIILGLLTRFAAGSLFVIMTASCFFIAHMGGTFMPSMTSPMSYVFNIVFAVGFLALTVSGAGSFSIDRLIGKKLSVSN